MLQKGQIEGLNQPLTEEHKRAVGEGSLEGKGEDTFYHETQPEVGAARVAISDRLEAQ